MPGTRDSPLRGRNSEELREMAKKQTRRSISVSGDTYNAVRDYCDLHKLSASGLVSDLLNKYLEEHADGPDKMYQAVDDDEDATEEQESAPAAEPGKTARAQSLAKVSPPQAVRDMKYPDRRGPGFTSLPDGARVSNWLITAHLDISRKRQIDAQTAVETLLHNLVHRRMVNSARVVKVEMLED
jgi:hypothetical protein